jgi:hypothetical protein
MNTFHQNSLVLEDIILHLHVERKFINALLFLKTLSFKVVAFNASREKLGHFLT